ncbi:MAG: ABC transporter permease [Clostridia bacterium]
MYFKLAATNLKKNARIYLPYMITCTATIMMFYIMMFLATNKGIDSMAGDSSISVVLNFGSIIIGIFAAIFLFYTNSFLIKRRKKEFGLYNILGMEKKHISGLMAIENLYTTVISMVFGLFFGVLFSKLMMMLLEKIIRHSIGFQFYISTPSIAITVLLFLGIFTLTFLNNMHQIRLSNPVELMRGGEVGEKEPKTKWVLAVIGAICLGIGYYLALSVESPLAALGKFFIAVILVIVGTYCLFTAGSIALLKVLRKNKKYYYKLRHFTSVSGMIYRMKQNAVGLANICILSTMVLVMLSSTVCLYIGLDDALRSQYPRDIEVNVVGISEEDSRIVTDTAQTALSKSHLNIDNYVDYRSKYYALEFDGSEFTLDEGGLYTSNTMASGYFIPLSEYNRMTGTDTVLADNEMLVYTPNGSQLSGTILFSGITYHIKSTLDELPVVEDFTTRFYHVYYFILPDEGSIETINSAFYSGAIEWEGLSQYIGFDVDTSEAAEIRLLQTLEDALYGIQGMEYYSMYVNGSVYMEDSFMSVYGGLFFLGLFLGALFMMATVLIIYYKQISEGYDDKRRFEIMQQVGMSKGEVKGAIRSQVITVFFLPLVTALVHITFAFPMISKLLQVLNLTNISLFVYCTLGTAFIFAIMYTIVYSLTARAYYRIVE